MCEYSNRIGYYITTYKNGLFSNNSAYPYIICISTPKRCVDQYSYLFIFLRRFF